ncbi:MAG: hypothetical protein FD180_4892 [Planctomycetota bacterium]|nr:MAG: hypothetical protein FD180_4892 [Planctomycetota bacterium]
MRNALFPITLTFTTAQSRASDPCFARNDTTIGFVYFASGSTSGLSSRCLYSPSSNASYTSNMTDGIVPPLSARKSSWQVNDLGLRRTDEARHQWQEGAALLQRQNDVAELNAKRGLMHEACAKAGVPPFDEETA